MNAPVRLLPDKKGASGEIVSPSCEHLEILREQMELWKFRQFQPNLKNGILRNREHSLTAQYDSAPVIL